MTFVNMAQNIRLPDLVGGYTRGVDTGLTQGKAFRLRELAREHGVGLSNMNPTSLDAYAREDPTMVADLRYRSKRDADAAARDERNFGYRVQRDGVMDNRDDRDFGYRAERDKVSDSRTAEQTQYDRDRDSMSDRERANERAYERDRDAKADDRYDSEDSFRREKFGYQKGQDAAAAARQKMVDDRTINKEVYEREFAETSRSVAGLVAQVDSASDKSSAYKQALAQAKAMGMDVSGIPPEYSPEVMGFLRGYYGITSPSVVKPLSPEGKRDYDRRNGYDIESDGDGNVVLADGTKTKLPAADLTEGQSKNVRFTNRMIVAEQTLTELSNSGYDPTNVKDVALDSRGWSRWLKSEDGKRWKAAAGEWIVAMIRPDTGAAVTEQEWELYGPIYFPKFGDTPAVMAEKAEKRQTATDSAKLVLGVNVYGKESDPNAPKPPRMGDIREGEGGIKYRFMGGRISDRSNWVEVE